MSTILTLQERMELTALCGIHIGEKWEIHSYDTLPPEDGKHPVMEVVFKKEGGIATIRHADPTGEIAYCVNKIKSRLPSS